MKTVGLQLGDSLLLLAMVVWVSVRVGPLWLGAVLFVCAGLINFISSRL